MDRTWKLFIVLFLGMIAAICVMLVIPMYFKVPQTIIDAFWNICLGSFSVLVTEMAIKSKMITKAKWLVRIIMAAFFLLNFHSVIRPSLYLYAPPSPLEIVRLTLIGIILLCFTVVVIAHSKKQKTESLGIKTP